MVSVTIDRRDGLNSAAAIKGPCRVATTANITLSGLQTVDGVALAEGDRVLCKDQTDARDNGIRIVSTGNWERAADFRNSRDVVTGTQVYITHGTVSAERWYGVTAANPISVGTTNLTFAVADVLSQVEAIADAFPDIAANTMLVDNAAGTARETKTFEEVRNLLGLVRNPRNYRYETAGDPEVLREVVASGGEYKAFPVATRLPSGRIVSVYWRGNGHSPTIAGDGLGQIDAIYSDDGGAEWSSPAPVYGNMTNGDPAYAYFPALGTDRAGRAILLIGIYEGSYVRPYITRSVDGVVWSTPIRLTITGTALDTGGTMIPFGAIQITPSGRLLVPMYQDTKNWIGVIDDDVSETTLDLSRLVVNSSSPAYSESAICCITENEWLCFIRLDGAVNSIPIFRTVNGGASWTTLGDTGMPVGGGYVVQAAFPFEICGVTHIGVITGARKSVSGPIAGAPGLIFAAASYKDMTDTGDPQFRRRHLWPMADDGFVRDCYAGYVFDNITKSLFVVTHEETADTESRITVGAVNVGSAMGGKPERARKLWTPVLYGATTAGTATYTIQRGSYTEDGDWIEFDFRLDISAFDGTGNLWISGWPGTFAADQEMSIQTAYTLTGGTSLASLRPTAETSTAAIMERQGLSFLASTEVSYPLSIRARGRYMKHYDY